MISNIPNFLKLAALVFMSKSKCSAPWILYQNVIKKMLVKYVLCLVLLWGKCSLILK